MRTVVVECGNDEALMLALGLPARLVKHEGNRDEVVKYILKHPAGGPLGLVDEDPGTEHGGQRKQFVRGKALHQVRTDRFGHRALVVLMPRLEDWLVQAVKSAGGSMAKLDKSLSDDPAYLHRELNPMGDTRMAKIVGFLQDKKSKHLSELRKALDI
jgi:hypothetical protein